MEVDTGSVTSPFGSCEHARAITSSTKMLEYYKKALAWSGARYGAEHSHSKRRKMQAPMCGTCKLSLHRPVMCLECRFIGCWKQEHIQTHLRQSSHTLAVDMVTGIVFCASCNDFRYFETPRMGSENGNDSRLVPGERKRKWQSFQDWQPTSVEKAELQKVGRVPCGGRRGFLNLGATCYLSVVLQCLLHNPLLRNFFLSDKHNSKLCSKSNCMCCELDQLFADVYAADPSYTSESLGETGPALGPVSLLRTTWENSVDIAGYAQQDAHELFIALLNQLHLGSAEATNGSSCACVVHQVFAGQLQSDVKCGKCGHVNPTVDPMLDISLELKDIQNGKGVTLASCLRRFTGQEKLQPKDYVCGQCKTSAIEATKQLSIRKLPPVLCIQLKRFEHKASSSKIDTPVKFPVTINMAPYTTAMIGMEARKESSLKPENLAFYDYELFAVVNHEGQLNSGHYTNFARSQSEWYRFDDEKITHVTLKDCLGSVPYMCFYVKRNLEYGTVPPVPQKPPVAVELPKPATPKVPVTSLASEILHSRSVDPDAEPSTPSSDARSTTSEH
ncbi:hypothetical protein M408DRAFT_326298 [Serendipita vermifera MAFF 305830]|uniref:Ubiquitin carboxyl-terminal hydrolase n=1 Tax=Serendipita vermifera MAFF 305830 TaxID=933852 RepID=A0A0C2XXQ9_SERVB|nr:hypothetical protein M408DRAFT_326298 [Serendipita vermifera MAFF 305830]